MLTRKSTNTVVTMMILDLIPDLLIYWEECSFENIGLGFVNSGTRRFREDDHEARA
jgi:hypothetical protein